MFANTLTLTIDGSAHTLLRVNQDNFGSAYVFKDATKTINMKIRHDVETQRGGLKVNRHNILIERTVFEVPGTSAEKYDSVVVTLRDREGSGPDGLLKLWQGANTLILTLDDTFVSGEN